jgi:hypothetical protein
MKKRKSILIEVLTIASIIGNILFMLWISYNGLKEHFKGTVYEKLSYFGLMILLIINSFLILRKNQRVSN